MVGRVRHIAFALLLFAASSVDGVAQTSVERDVGKRQLRARSAGNRLIITSNASLSDYAAYRGGERFYVLIPKAELSAGAALRAFPGASVERRGDDLVLSFRLPPDGAARVNQRFNRLEVVLSGMPAALSERGNEEKNARSTERPSKERPPSSRLQEAEHVLEKTPFAAATPIEPVAEAGEQPSRPVASRVAMEPKLSSGVRASDSHAKRDAALWFLVLSAALAVIALVWRAMNAKRKRKLVEAEAALPSESSVAFAEHMAVESATTSVSYETAAKTIEDARGCATDESRLGGCISHAPKTVEGAGEGATALRLVSDQQQLDSHQAEPAALAEPLTASDSAQQFEGVLVASSETGSPETFDAQEAAYRALSSAFDDASPEGRAKAARSLSRLAEEWRMSRAELFARAVREADAERRARIGEALALSGLADEALAQLTSEREAPEAFALLFIMAKTGALAPLLHAIQEEENNEVKLAIVRLLSLCDHPDVLPRLRELATESSLPAEVRLAVMEAIYQQSSARVRSATG
ncbi:MAG: hypothetical protein C4334_06615 [Pyrinomonas sp.]